MSKINPKVIPSGKDILFTTDNGRMVKIPEWVLKEYSKKYNKHRMKDIVFIIGLCAIAFVAYQFGTGAIL